MRWLVQGNRKYMKCLYVYNKIDVCSLEEVETIARQETSIPISCTQQLNLDTLLDMLWDMMGLVRSPPRRAYAFLLLLADSTACVMFADAATTRFA